MSLKIMVSVMLAFCLLFVISVSGKSAEEAASEKCAKEYKLDKAAIEKFNKTKPIETKDKNIKCYLKCLLVETKLMNAKGEFTLPKFENKRYGEITHACKTVNNKDICEKAYLFHKCVMEKKEPGHAKEHKL